MQLAKPACQSSTLPLSVSVCRQYVQLKTGQDLPLEGVEAALDEVLASYKSELGLTDKETDQLEHFQVSTLASYQYTLENNCMDFSIFDHGKLRCTLHLGLAAL